MSQAASFESLESRTFLDASAFPDFKFPERPHFPDIDPALKVPTALSSIKIKDGVLLVSGTHKDDRILVTRIDGRPQAFDSIGANFAGSNALMMTNKYGSVVLPVTTNEPESVILVRVGGERYYVDPAVISEIRIDGGAGEDSIRVAKNVGIHADLRGGVGDDTLEAGQMRDILRGGNGNDELIATRFGPVSRYHGGEGQDRLVARFTSRDTVPTSFDRPEGVEVYVFLSPE
jgi:Ca2+-binding RTX toxin-like protein